MQNILFAAALWLLIGKCFCLSCTCPTFFPHGANAGDTFFTADEISMITAQAPVPFLYYGQSSRFIYISENGYMTFSGRHTEFHTKCVVPSFSVPPASLFIYWTDLSAVRQGNVTFRIDDDTNLLSSIDNLIQGCAGDSYFASNVSLVVTWKNVQKYGIESAFTFQATLATNGTATYMISSYETLTHAGGGIGGQNVLRNTGFRHRYTCHSNTDDILRSTNFGCPGQYIIKISDDPSYGPLENGTLSCQSDPCENGASCVDTLSEYRCVCADGYAGQQCENDHMSDDFLLIADRGEAGKIWQIGIYDARVIELSTGIIGMSDVVYDSADDIIYFTTINSGLYKFDLDNNRIIETIYRDIRNIAGSHGMSYSPASRKLYIASVAYGIHTIDVDLYDIGTVYIEGDPRSWDIAVDDEHGHIYWTQGIPPSVQRLDDKSTPPKTIVSANNSPRGLHLDVPANKMYWLGLESSSSLVMMANLDGTARKSLVHIPFPIYAITGVNQHLFVAGPDGHLYKVANCNYTEIPVHADMSAWGLTGYSSSPYKPVCSKCCSHDGSLDIDTCNCTCTGHWGGDTCRDCDISCDNGGILDAESCSCLCQIPWEGFNCGECPKSCSNGGTLDVTKCDCICPALWSSVTCQECNVTCQNGGSLNETGCSCACEELWTGDHCEVCDTVCDNGGTLDNSTCTCACPVLWQGNTCQVCLGNCYNGGTIDNTTCKCDCNQPWTGDFCSEEVDGTTTVSKSPPPNDTGLWTIPFISLLAVSSGIILILVISIITMAVHKHKNRKDIRKQQSQKDYSPYVKEEVKYDYVEHTLDGETRARQYGETRARQYDETRARQYDRYRGVKAGDPDVYIELDNDVGYLKAVGPSYKNIHYGHTPRAERY